MSLSGIGNFIDGEWRAPASGAWLEVQDPATGEPIARAARSSAADCEAAARWPRVWRPSARVKGG